jgi:ribosomal protein S18 acetylase RimI-like enzyme
MNPILTQASDAELGAAVETNLFALFRAMAETLPGGEIVEGRELSYHYTFPTNPMFAGVWGTRLAADEVEEAITATLAWFQARRAPYVFWWIGPGTAPANLGSHLEARGLFSMEAQMQELAPGIRQTAAGAPGMAVDLHQVNESVLDATPADFTIEEVADKDALYDFKQVFVTSYEIPEWAGQAWVDATLSIGIGRTPWRMYVGRLAGEPVATNMLFTGAGVASVYAVGTVPAARGLGIGAAITLLPLLAARQVGYRYAVLFSTEMAVSVYRRIGFHLLETRINRYLWRAPRQAP